MPRRGTRIKKYRGGQQTKLEKLQKAVDVAQKAFDAATNKLELAKNRGEDTDDLYEDFETLSDNLVKAKRALKNEEANPQGLVSSQDNPQDPESDGGYRRTRRNRKKSLKRKSRKC
jgi:hypothetical protein